MEPATAGQFTDNYIGYTDSDDRVVEQRLAELLKLNAEIAREKRLYTSEQERLNVLLMTRPIDSGTVFSYFGMLIGSLPPFAIVLKLISETIPTGTTPLIFVVLLAAAGVATGVAGYLSGKAVASAVDRIATYQVLNRFALLSLVGFAWGALSGALGGLFIFFVGSIFAGIAGGVVGAITLPVLVGLHSTVRSGDFVEFKHFLPIAMGIVLTVCALILGS